MATNPVDRIKAPIQKDSKTPVELLIKSPLRSQLLLFRVEPQAPLSNKDKVVSKDKRPKQARHNKAKPDRVVNKHNKVKPDRVVNKHSKAKLLREINPDNLPVTNNLAINPVAHSTK